MFRVENGESGAKRNTRQSHEEIKIKHCTLVEGILITERKNEKPTYNFFIMSLKLNYILRGEVNLTAHPLFTCHSYPFPNTQVRHATNKDKELATPTLPTH